VDEKQDKLLNTVCLLGDVCKKQKIQGLGQLKQWHLQLFLLL